MTTTPVLTLPDFSKMFVIECDASGEAIGAILMQDDMPITYISSFWREENLKSEQTIAASYTWMSNEFPHLPSTNGYLQIDHSQHQIVGWAMSFHSICCSKMETLFGGNKISNPNRPLQHQMLGWAMSFHSFPAQMVIQVNGVWLWNCV